MRFFTARRKTTFALLFASICVLFAIKSAETVLADVQAITIDRVNLREQPSTDSAVLRVLEPQTDVTVTEILEDNWAKVIIEGQQGFIKTEYIGSGGQASPPATVPAAENIQTENIQSENIQAESIQTESIQSESIQTASVQMITLDRVNLREQPSTDAAALLLLEPKTSVTVTETLDQGWVKVVYDGRTGFVKAEYVGNEEQYIPPAPVQISMVTLDRVNLREQPSTDSPALRTLEPKTGVTISETLDSGWVIATYDGQRGYIKAEYIGTEAQYTPPEPVQIKMVTLNRVNFREQPSTEAPVLRVLDPKTDVTISETLEYGWLKTICDGQPGYIKAEYVGTEEQYAVFQQNLKNGPANRTVELLGWGTVKSSLPLGVPLEVYDVYSGKVYYVKSFSNGMHADVEPITATDTAIMKETYGGKWDWDARPVLVTINGRTIAGAINGMPHAGGVNDSNGMEGQVCLHFNGSSVHNGNMRYNGELQQAVHIAYNTYN